MKPLETDVHQPDGARTNGDRAHLEPTPAIPHPRIASAFPPIADYAFLSDCEVNALIAPSGRLEWMCLPRPDSPSVFAAMLDRAAGSFRFGPTGVLVPAGRPALPARHPGPGDDLEDQDGLDDRARRALHRACLLYTSPSPRD